MLVYLCAPNDPNGNPRRGWAYFIGGICRAFYEEGYSGHYALPEHLRDRRYEAPAIKVSPREYSTWKSAGNANSAYQEIAE